tara:strand:- start:24366 stop:25526 length:1161 start_codon:yes stop_codon:yes gene_type:complete
LQVESLPRYSVSELNQAISALLSRGFAPLFLLNATVSKCQLKRGHLWMTLTDGESTIDAVVWSSRIPKVNYQPKEQDGVLIIGKLNFWQTQARISINVIEIKASISTVLRKFEVVRKLLLNEGLINQKRKRSLPKYPSSIAILTSVPSSALADMLRTAKERWPLTKLFIIPIPVQGDVEIKINSLLNKLSKSYKKLGIQAVILSRGGGSREDLMVFDTELLCRKVANFPIPLITGIGHEDDLTVVDLVADHRAATPTAAIVDLLPDRRVALSNCIQKQLRLSDYCSWFIKNQRNIITKKLITLKNYSPFNLILNYKNQLDYKNKLLNALSPRKLLSRGFCIVRNEFGEIITSVSNLEINSRIRLQLDDGKLDSIVENIDSSGDGIE